MRSIYLGAWVGGFAFWLLAIHWIWWTDDSAWLGWVVMAVFLSIWWPAFVFLARFAKRRLGLPLIVAAPVLWVALEYVRAFILTGFPWYYLAHSQYRLLYLTQIADFSGALGLSFLIAMVNAFWVDLLTLPLFRRKVGGSMVGSFCPGADGSGWSSSGRRSLGTLGYGVFRVSSAEFRRRPSGRACSSRTRSSSSTPTGSRSNATIQAILESLIRTRDGGKSPARPDRLAGDVLPLGLRRRSTRSSTRRLLDRQVKEFDPESIGGRLEVAISGPDRRLLRRAVMRATKVPMMVGSSIYDFKTSGLLEVQLRHPVPARPARSRLTTSCTSCRSASTSRCSRPSPG